MIMALIISVRYDIGELGAFGGLEARNSKEDDVEVQMVCREKRRGRVRLLYVGLIML